MDSGYYKYGIYFVILIICVDQAASQNTTSCQCVSSTTVPKTSPCNVTINSTTGDLINASQASAECQCTLTAPYAYTYSKGTPYNISCYSITTTSVTSTTQSTSRSSSTTKLTSSSTTTKPSTVTTTKPSTVTTTSSTTSTTTKLTSTTSQSKSSSSTSQSTGTGSTNTGTSSATTVAVIIGDTVNSNTTDEEPLFLGPCNTTVLSEKKHKIVKYLMYFASFWIILCCLIAILITLCYRETGHHRFLNFLQELAFIFLYAILGYFMWDPLNKKATYHYTMVLILSFFLFEAIFARSLIKGSSRKNGTIPPVLNYILPFFLAAIPTVVSYFTAKDYYAFTGVHCFVSIYTKLFWSFVAPAWFLTMNIILTGQLSFLACEQAKPDVDQKQLFWAFKTSKSRPTFVMFFISTYFLLMFAVDMQNFVLFIAYAVLCVIFGIFIIIFHTYCYMNTATKLYKSTSLPPYRPCKKKKEPEKKKQDPPQPTPVPQPPPAPLPYPENLHQRRNAGHPSQASQNDPFNPTQSRNVYNWATDRDMGTLNKVENVFFKPRIM
uniref:Uncharacterized protein n=1 Tax=Acrobeloides nanus TaxID=290746 RepID=A0A914C318_9BILA